MKKGTQLLMSALLMVGATCTAQAAVIDFESLAHNDDQIVDHGAIYEEEGFRLTNTAADPSFATYGTALDGWYVGSTALINDNAGGTTVLTSMDGGLFRMNSIALAELYAMEEPFSVTFTGLLSNGSTVSQVFSLDGLFGAETFAFDSAFTNLVSVSWLQSEYFHQFDNIDVVPVPEPSTFFLFGAGLLSVAAVRRRRK